MLNMKRRGLQLPSFVELKDLNFEGIVFRRCLGHVGAEKRRTHVDTVLGPICQKPFSADCHFQKHMLVDGLRVREAL